MPSGERRRRGMPVSLRSDFIQNTRRDHLSLAFTGRPLISGGARSFRHSLNSRDELVCLPLPPLHHRKTQRHRIYPVQRWWCLLPTVRPSLPTRQATTLGEYIYFFLYFLPHYYILPPPPTARHRLLGDTITSSSSASLSSGRDFHLDAVEKLDFLVDFCLLFLFF